MAKQLTWLCPELCNKAIYIMVVSKSVRFSKAIVQSSTTLHQSHKQVLRHPYRAVEVCLSGKSLSHGCTRLCVRAQ